MLTMMEDWISHVDWFITSHERKHMAQTLNGIVNEAILHVPFIGGRLVCVRRHLAYIFKRMKREMRLCLSPPLRAEKVEARSNSATHLHLRA